MVFCRGFFGRCDGSAMMTIKVFVVQTIWIDQFLRIGLFENRARPTRARTCFKRRKNTLLVNATKHMKKWEHMKLNNILYTSVHLMRCMHNARLFMPSVHELGRAYVPFQPCTSINYLQKQVVTAFTLHGVESVSPYPYQKKKGFQKYTVQRMPYGGNAHGTNALKGLTFFSQNSAQARAKSEHRQKNVSPFPNTPQKRPTTP